MGTLSVDFETLQFAAGTSAPAAAIAVARQAWQQRWAWDQRPKTKDLHPKIAIGDLGNIKHIAASNAGSPNGFWVVRMWWHSYAWVAYGFHWPEKVLWFRLIYPSSYSFLGVSALAALPQLPLRNF